MANVDWNSLTEHHTNGTLKEHITSAFSNPKANDAYLQYCKYFLSCYYSESAVLPELAVSVSILRVFISTVPVVVLSDIQLDIKLLNWLHNSIKENPDRLSINGAVISVVTLIARNIPNALSKYLDNIMECFCTSMEIVALLTAQSDLSGEQCTGVMIVLHQLEELLNVLGNSKQSAQLSKCSTSICQMATTLLNISSWDANKLSNIDRLHVDCAKLFNMLSDIWVNANTTCSGYDSTIDLSHAKLLCSVPQSLFHIVATGRITHDCFHGAYHGAIQVLRILKSVQYTDDIQAIAQSTWNNALNQCAQYVTEGGVLTAVSDCGRIETVVGFLSCFFDVETSSVTLNTSSCAVSLEQVDTAISGIITLQNRMRAAVQSFTSSNDVSKETQKELKSMYSDIRKGSIATATMVVTAGGEAWMASNQDVFWDLSLKSLMTPVLFSAGYKAVSGDLAFTTRMLTFLDTALRSSVSRYSVAAAEDIILTLQELIDSCIHIPCQQLFDCDDNEKYNIPTALLAAYAQCPKATNSGEAGLNWKIAVVVTINALIQQCTKLRVDGKRAELSLEFLSQLTELYSLEMTRSGQGEQGGVKATSKKSNNADLRAELLQSVTIGLISIVEVLKTYVVQFEQSIATTIRTCLSHLAARVMQQLNRAIVFEDDRVQLCTEVDLLSRIAMHSISWSSTNNHNSLLQPVVTISTVALCNMIYTRNSCDPSLIANTDSCFVSLDYDDDSSEETLLRQVSQLLDELRCVHASSLSGTQQQKVHISCDVIYEAVREAILSITHHCVKPSEEGGALTDKQNLCIQRIYDALPLEVNKQPPLDTSMMSSGDYKLSLSSSFVLDILSSMRELIEL